MSQKNHKNLKKPVSVIIPIYNEQESLVQTIWEIKNILEKNGYSYEIIAVDDGSTDKSGELLDQIKGIKVIHHQFNRGYGSSLKTGINAAKNDWIVMIDADGTYPIVEIPNLLQYAPDYDLVTGMRIGKEAKIPLLRRPAKFILSKLANFLAGQKIPDLNCGLRVIKKSNVTKFYDILPQKFSFTITHLLACLTSDCSVKYISIPYYHRKGKSSIHPIKDFLRFLNIIFRVITYFNPLKMFSLMSFLLFLVGVIIFCYSFFISGTILDLTVVVIMLAALQVFLFGLIADLIIKKTKH